jgi:hypothetical protein
MATIPPIAIEIPPRRLNPNKIGVSITGIISPMTYKV